MEAEDYVSSDVGNPHGYPDEPCPTYHIHDDGGWEWGAVCGVCVASVEPAGAKGPYFNIYHLRRQNALGVSTRQEVADVLSNIKPEDRDKIGRA